MTDPYGEIRGFDARVVEPLCALCERGVARSLVWFGSAAAGPLRGADVDLHVVVPRVDRPTYELVVSAARSCADGAAARSGRPWHVELRHGPFKCRPGGGEPSQLHVVLDDPASLARTSCAIALQRLATGRVLAGDPPIPDGCGSADRRVAEARRELARWRLALSERVIPFRRWQVTEEPTLQDECAPATDAWELRCLLRAASVSARLHVSALDGWEPSGTGRPAPAPLVEPAAWQHDWQRLTADWPVLAATAIARLDGLLGDLALRPSADAPADADAPT